MRVWIVVRGEYSDWNIEGVFSSKEKAEEYVDSNKYSYRSVYIEEDKGFEVDELKTTKPQYVRVIMTRSAGGYGTTEIREDDKYKDEFYSRWYDGTSRERYETTIELGDKTREQLAKIAQDRRTKCMYQLLERGEL